MAVLGRSDQHGRLPRRENRTLSRPAGVDPERPLLTTRSLVIDVYACNAKNDDRRR
jgi:hypothetical protein